MEKQKVYVVIAEWQDRHGDSDSFIIGVYANQEDARKALKKERDTIIAEGRGHQTLEEYKADNNYEVEDTDDRFWLKDIWDNAWDEIIVSEEEIK